MSKFIYDKKTQTKKTFFLIKKEIYIVDNLKIIFFININIINSKKTIINIFEKDIHFKITNVSIICETKTKNAIKIRRVIKTINFFLKLSQLFS